MKVPVDQIEILVAIDEEGMCAMALGKQTRKMLAAVKYNFEIPQDCLEQILSEIK